jgi:hypothetical protein
MSDEPGHVMFYNRANITPADLAALKQENERLRGENERLHEITTISRDRYFVFCEKCNSLLPPQMASYIWGYCPACGRAIKGGDK